MVAEVSRLDQVVPMVAELQVTDFENSEHCMNLAYARGSFGHLEQDGCAREDTGPFDAVAHADHTRLARANRGVGCRHLPDPHRDIRAGRDLETAWFVLEGAPILDYWEYLYDPTGVEPKQDVPGRIDFTFVADDWWFVRSFDD